MRHLTEEDMELLALEAAFSGEDNLSDAQYNHGGSVARHLADQEGLPDGMQFAVPDHRDYRKARAAQQRAKRDRKLQS